MNTQDNNFRIDLVKSSDDFCQTYSKIEIIWKFMIRF